MSGRHLVLMLKEPRAGRVKTRLGREIGMVAAAWWFRHQCARAIRRLDDPRWQLWLAVSPDSALHSRAWSRHPSGHLPRLAQGRGDLGVRMARIFRVLPPGPALIVGADIPGIRPAHVARAFGALGRNDAVFGPAPDGGYWLVGLGGVRPPPPAFLRGVRWSGPHAMADSIATLPGRRVALVDTLSDVDTAADLSALST